MTDRYCEYQTKQMKVALESIVVHASWPAMSEPLAERKGESNGEVVPFGKLETRDMQEICKRYHKSFGVSETRDIMALR
jgi:hypothetical protein